jgi:aminopeptidase-like protein
MDLEDILLKLKKDKIEGTMFRLIEDLYPIYRSITGNGTRSTLGRLKAHIPIETCEVPTGEKVFDWIIPKEWNIRDAYIKDKSGKKIIDLQNSNLHTISYSIPINKKMTLSLLKKHLYSIPDHPEWIPYKTSYYKENWGFCLSHTQLQQLKDEEYHVYIDSTLHDGSLTYGELYLPGKLKDEVIFSTHICHPSLCNDNLSGISLVTFLAKTLSEIDLKYSYRFLFVPATIGSITWLARNEIKVENIKYGLVIACVGDSGEFTYKKSRQGNAEIDKLVALILKQTQTKFTIKDFSPYGYDERQYCSPGFNLPVGSLSRSTHGTYKEYHTSADNLDFINSIKLGESLKICLRIVHAIETNNYYININPKCEPQLGKRGLYDIMHRDQKLKDRMMAMLWILNYSDGQHSLVDISELSQIDFSLIAETASILAEHKLLEETLSASKK